MIEPQRGEQAIFDAAIELPASERVAYLDRVTAGDATLRQRLRELIAGYENGDFLEDAAAASLRSTIDACESPAEKPGERIGRYKLLQVIGEGGCGVVYMAEQEEPVRRRVALKIIKLGMDTKSVIARFEAERQALALMDHRNIAKVFDAGATETGRPYFVMELVRGMKITEYCDEAKLPIRPRLALFIQVCQAIQHAHQKGIIHRDLKPSNILVTINDGVPVPKVIDFGIAKATSGQRLTDKTIFTAFEQFIGTPAYMSPEQVVLTSVDIDTRSDIYALGVLLYELLCGTTPFETKKLLAIGFDEMRRTIREQEPERPSTRLSTLAGGELSTMAQRRGIEAPRLLSGLRGDLDWIVMKCLEKDRARRYETANGLATDIQRHLNDDPVVARPPSSFYKFQKLIRRHRVTFIATSAVAAALILGLGIATWMFFEQHAALKRARIAENKAQAETSKSRQVVQFLKDIIWEITPKVAKGENSVLVSHILEETSSQLGWQLKDQPEVQAEVLQAIARVYGELGDDKRAEAAARDALMLSRLETLADQGKLYEEAPVLLQHLPETAVEPRMLILRTCCSVAFEKGQMPEVDRVLAQLSLRDAGRLDKRIVLRVRADLLAQYCRWQEAEEELTQALNLDPNDIEAWHPLAVILVQTGQIETYREQCRKALDRFKDRQDARVGDHIAKDCSILPPASADLEALGKMGDAAVGWATGTDYNIVPWCQFAKALAEYRLDHFTNAVEWTEKVLEHQSQPPELYVEAYTVNAMAWQRRQQPAKARAALAKGAGLAETKLLKLSSGNLGTSWIDWIIAQALLREAQALIEPNAATISEVRGRTDSR